MHHVNFSKLNQKYKYNQTIQTSKTVIYSNKNKPKYKSKSCFLKGADLYTMIIFIQNTLMKMNNYNLFFYFFIFYSLSLPILKTFPTYQIIDTSTSTSDATFVSTMAYFAPLTMSPPAYSTIFLRLASQVHPNVFIVSILFLVLVVFYRNMSLDRFRKH